MLKVSAVTESLRILMTGSIDYAGLFPPAALPMKTAVSNFDAYRSREQGWMLNRFVVPVVHFQEFGSAFDEVSVVSKMKMPWKLSAIVGSDAKSDIAKIVDFNRQTPLHNMAVASLEAKAADCRTVCRLAELVPHGLESYVEIPCSNLTEECIKAIADFGLRVKLRTGGDNAQMFPSRADVARVLVVCASADVPVKASAGLHHAIRSIHRYTYEPDSPSGTMHGFLNLFLAAAFARKGMDIRGVEQVLAEQSGEAFRFDHMAVCWHDCCITNEELAAARKAFCISFGSCSFDEPLDDLRELGLL
jgi:hypothetical protein